jgi:PBSX family phage terminase large subunit
MAYTLADLERQLSRAQVLSIVQAKRSMIALWSGSVGAGKTHASLLAFLLAVIEAPSRGEIVIIGRTLDTVYVNVFTLLQDPNVFGFDIANQVKYTRGAKNAVIFGRSVTIVGANDSAAVGRIQGSTISLAYVDEAVLLLEPFWDMLITRLRVEGARVLATMNPGSTNHWMRKKWILPGLAKDVQHFSLTMDDNPTYDNDWGRAHKARMKRQFSGIFYDRMIRGLWTNAAGAVYPMWDESVHLISPARLPLLDRVIGVGIDYGTTNPTRGLMVGITKEAKRRLVILDEFAYDANPEGGIPRISDYHLSNRYRAWLRTPHITSVSPRPDALLPPEWHVVDPSGASFIQQLYDDQLPVMLADNSVLPGIQTMSNLLDQRKLVVVAGRAPKFEEEITEYQWSEKATLKGEDVPDKEPNKDHSMDAARYVLHTLKYQYDSELEYTAQAA